MKGSGPAPLHAIDLARIGHWSDPVEFDVDGDHIRAYASATNEHDPRFLAGEVAPPVFAAIPAMYAMRPAMSAVLAPAARARSLHGEHELVIEQPLRAGMRVRSRAAALGVRSKGRHATVLFRVDAEDQQGAHLNSQFNTLFVFDAGGFGDVGEVGHDYSGVERMQSPPDRVVRERVDPDQTFRYAEASGDHNPLHLDEGIARAAGYPSVIVHGLCILAFCARAVTDSTSDREPLQLRRLGARFARPLFPGQSLTTRIWFLEEGRGRRSLAFDALESGGDTIVTRGHAYTEVDTSTAPARE